MSGFGRGNNPVAREVGDRGVKSPDPSFSLEWLVAPIGKRRFLSEYWEKKPLVLQRREPDRFRSLLTLDDVDRAITALHLDYPDVSVVNAQRPVNATEYVTSKDRVDVARVSQLYAQGCTVILSRLHDRLEALAALCHSLECEFTFPFQTNVYLTPANAQGFKPHFDTHDVWVLQVAGEKHWTIQDSPVVLPSRGQEYDPETMPLDSAIAEFDLCPGDAVYIPRGYVHHARSSSQASLHITLGVLSYTWADLLVESLAAVILGDHRFRKSLPPGFASAALSPESARTTFAELIEEFTRRANCDDALDTFISDFLDSRHHPLRGHIKDLSRVLDVNEQTRFSSRPDLAFRLEESAGQLQVRGYGKEISFPSHISAAVRFALTACDFTIGDLPGELNNADALVLVRRLIREGVVTVSGA